MSKNKDWTKEEDELLIKMVFDNANNGENIQLAFKVFSQQSERSINAIAYRWNNNLKKTINFDPLKLKREAKKKMKNVKKVVEKKDEQEVKSIAEKGDTVKKENKQTSKKIISSKEVIAYITQLEKEHNELKFKYSDLTKKHKGMVDAIAKFAQED